MKIIYITAGAAGMYCGSCLRDNALATELISHGHDAILVPLYTPTLTDEPNVSQEKVFFGGISVYLQQHVSLFRKTPKMLDRLWDSSFALKLASRRSIPVDPQTLGELTISMLKGEGGHQRKELSKLVDWMRSEGAPDVIDLQNSLLSGLAAPIKRALKRPVCCTLQGEDLFLEGLEGKYRDEALRLVRANVEHIDGFIAVSDYYADYMSDYIKIPRAKIHVVPLGINFKGHGEVDRAKREQLKIGFFARIAPEKGLHLLCEAYRMLRERGELGDSRLECAGYMAAENREYLAGIERKMKEWGLGDEFRYRGVLDRQEKIAFLQSLDIMSVPATYDEPKGLSLLEAMANGVPVVQPRRGSFTEVVEKTRGGVLVKPDDAGSLADGILSLARDRDLRLQLGRQGYEGARAFYSAASMAERALGVYEALSRTSSRAQLPVSPVLR